MQADARDQPVLDLEEGAGAYLVTLPAGLRQAIISSQILADNAVLAGCMSPLWLDQDHQRLDHLAIAMQLPLQKSREGVAPMLGETLIGLQDQLVADQSGTGQRRADPAAP